MLIAHFHRFQAKYWFCHEAERINQKTFIIEYWILTPATLMIRTTKISVRTARVIPKTFGVRIPLILESIGNRKDLYTNKKKKNKNETSTSDKTKRFLVAKVEISWKHYINLGH
jgi:hypothetical protein